MLLSIYCVRIFHTKQGEFSKTATRDHRRHKRSCSWCRKHYKYAGYTGSGREGKIRVWGSAEEYHSGRPAAPSLPVRASSKAGRCQKQVDAIWHLVFKKEDLLLAAKTSFFKSVIFQAAPLFCHGGIGLIIIPLDRIGQEQCIKIQRLPGARSVFINGKTDKTDILAQDIEMVVYTYLSMGPEIAAGWFRSIARNPSFKRHVSVVAVDELHLVALWGSGTRPQYAQLCLLRRRLGGDVPWFGCSATLDQKTLDIARKMVGFQASCEFFRSSVDRPEIKLIVEAIQPRTTKRFTSLFFVLLHAMTHSLSTPERIPKTVIFIDSRRDIQKCAECLREWLQKLSAGAIKDRDCRQIIQVCHSHTTLKDKNTIYDEFSKANSKIRIIVATESLGTGVDLSDAKRVVHTASLGRLDNLSTEHISGLF